MSEIFKTRNVAILLSIAVASVSLVVSFICFDKASISEKRSKNMAIELEEIKIEMRDLKKHCGTQDSSGGTDSSFIQNKLNNMRAELEMLRKNKDSKALDEYKKEKNKFWMEYAEGVKKNWSAFLHDRLVEKGIEPDDIELIKYDYEVMLNRIRDEQLRWYDGNSSIEDLQKATSEYAKDFFSDMSHSVGEQKASITLAIVFPDQAYRKSLFDEKE